MATIDDLSAGIAPGSLPHGARKTLEAGLGDALAGAPSLAPAPSVGQPEAPLDSVDDPLAALLSGELDPGGQNDPLTSGLSVGPGPGPAGQEPADPIKTRLQAIATQAASPIVRAAARNELRRLNGERV